MKRMRCRFGVPVYRSAGSVSGQSLKSWNFDWRLRPLRSVCARPGLVAARSSPPAGPTGGVAGRSGRPPGEQGRGTDQSGRSGMSRGRPSCPEGM